MEARFDRVHKFTLRELAWLVAGAAVIGMFIGVCICCVIALKIWG